MPQTFSDLVNIFVRLISLALPVVSALAFLVFLWGLIKFIYRAGGDEKAVEEGKSLMIWGLIALFILLSFRAILYFAYSDLGFSRPFPSVFLPE